MRSERPSRAKRKKLPVILTILAVLAIAATGVFLYLTPDSAAKEQYQEEAAVMAQGVTDKRLAQLGEQTAGLLGDRQGAGAPAAEGSASAAGLLTEEQPADSNTAGAQGVKPALTQEQIATLTASLTGVYDQILADLQQDGVGMVNQLVEQAKADYRQLKASQGNDAAAVGKLAAEYMSRGSALEAEMDSSFAAVIGAMREQMKSLGIPPEPIINDYQKRYEQIKAERQKTLIDKALKAVE